MEPRHTRRLCAVVLCASACLADNPDFDEPVEPEIRNRAVLSHSQGGECDPGVWCYDAIEGLAAGPTDVAECFEIEDLKPPYRITSIGWTIGDADVVEDFEVRLHLATDEGLPGEMRRRWVLGQGAASIGEHRLDLDFPYELPQAEICLAFHSSGAVQFGHDERYHWEGSSHIMSETCGWDRFTPTSTASPLRHGNWCITGIVTASPADDERL